MRKPTNSNKNRPSLVLLAGGELADGPVTRLGLWDRFPQVNKTQVGVMLVTKTLLVVAFVYYLYF